MDFGEGIPKDKKTMIVIPSILKSGDDVRKIFKKLEVYYLANKSDNIYCMALGDCSFEKAEKQDFDDDIIKAGLYEVDRLNKKYSKDENIFNFAYRRRIWSNSEKGYMGWERKRGLLTQLNSFLQNKKQRNDFLVNTLEKQNLKIKYIITLDQDTSLPLNAGIELIEAASHPLNTPVIQNGRVVEGYGIIQPRVGINLKESKQSLFSEIFAGSGGVDSYTNAISDTYQDNFMEGIYTGKGIYDLEVFESVMNGKIPENTVLSHDLLEGCYLRCGLASDIMLLDGYPKSYLSSLARLHRWIRGDYQIISWIKKKDLNKLSKFKIIDNIRRSLIEIISALNIILLILSKLFLKVKIALPIIVILISLTVPSLVEIVNYIVFRKENIKRQKSFTKSINGFRASFYRALINIMELPTKSFMAFDAGVRTIYRMRVSKDHLLEWTTSDEVDKQSKNSLRSIFL